MFLSEMAIALSFNHLISAYTLSNYAIIDNMLMCKYQELNKCTQNECLSHKTS